ncbi:hypothetical protein [Burkholderia gladioli]|uniref:hypothetical protein n=1 Tax=Burkholderia gladioli TaxID=28095 RepID=UPI001640C27E|nr:hypothetical protein [Burkholderia gladioli]
MTDKSNLDMISFVAGEVHALINVINALIAIHPDQQLVAQALQAAEQASEARIVPSATPEAFLEGAREAHEKFAEASKRFQVRR